MSKLANSGNKFICLILILFVMAVSTLLAEGVQVRRSKSPVAQKKSAGNSDFVVELFPSIKDPNKNFFILSPLAPPPSNEIQISTSAPYAQWATHVAVDQNGNFIVSWQSDLQDGSGWGLFARRYNAFGAPIGGEFPVNTLTAGNQFIGEIGIDSNGNFTIIWESENSDGNGYGVRGQRFDSSGTPLGTEFQVNSTTAGSQANSVVAMAPGGEFVAIWVSDGQDGSGTGIFGQRFNSSGSAVGSEFQVNVSSSGDQAEPAIGMDSLGNFVAVWQSSGQDGSGNGIYSRRFDSTGVPQTGDVLVNTTTVGDQVYGTVDVTATGEYVIAWDSDGQDGSQTGIFAQRFDSSGSPQGGEFQVNSYFTSFQLYPSVSVDASGNFVVVWESSGQDGSGYGIFGQSFDSLGIPQGGEFQINTYIASDQFGPVVAMDTAGNFLTVWTSVGQDGFAEGVYGRLYSVNNPSGNNSIFPTSQSFGAAGGSNTVAVTSSSGTWSATSNDAWISITSPGSGVGNDVVGYSVANNVSFSSRVGTMTIAGLTFTVSQAGATANAAPNVKAGSDQVITLPSLANLAGNATDDGLPVSPGALTLTWSKVSGPGIVTFGDANLASTTADFSLSGVYVLRLTADDGEFSSADEMTVTVNVASATGIMSASRGDIPPTVDLSAGGPSDWAHWGLVDPSSFNHKNGVTQQISNYTPIGSGIIQQFTGNPEGFSWNDGTPNTAVTNTTTGLWVIGLNNGYQVTVPADPIARTLKIYLGAWSAQGRIEVTSSENGSTSYIDTSVTSNSPFPRPSHNAVYTLDYRSATPGHTLTLRWTANATFDGFGFENVTLHAAQLTPNPAFNLYTLTYTAGANGSITGTSPQMVNSGADGTAVTAVADAGYHFVDWSDASTQNPRTDTNVTADITVTANFAINPYTLTYDGNGNTGGMAPVDPNSPYNNNALLTVLGNTGGLTKTGYTFNGWNTAANGSGTAYAPAATFNITADTTLYAQWTVNQYSIIYNGNGNTGGTAPPAATANYSSSVTLAGAGTLVKTGYTFNGWNTAANGSGTAYAEGASFTIPAADTTLYAQWTISTYTISASAGTGGSISPNGAVPVNHGADQIFMITPDANYHILDVLVDGVSAGAVTSYTFTQVTAAHTIAASFAIDTNTITSSAGPGGSISPLGAVPVNYGGSQLFTITASANYHIVDVLVDGFSVGAVGSYDFINVTAAHTIAASFAPNNLYTISGNIQRYDFPAANTNLAGVTVDLNGDQTGSTTTDASGNYNFTGLAGGGSYLITPSLAGYNFDPISRSYSNLSADITTADFTGYTVSSPRLISLVTQNVVPGSQAVVPVTMVSQGNENSIGFSISYDPAVLSNPVVAIGTDCGGCGPNLIVNSSISGLVGVIVSRPAGLMFTAGTRQVVTITFDTTSMPPAFSTPLTFGDSPVPREVTTANTDPLLAAYSGGAVTFATGYESDVAPRFNGTGTGVISVADYTQTGRFAAGLDTVNPLFNELQRADSAPRPTKGNGSITVADYVQAGRYAAGLDAAETAGGVASLFSPEEITKKQQAQELLLLPRILRAVDVATSRGQQVTVSIQIDAEGDENGFGFTVSYDTTKLSNPVVMTGADLPTSIPIPNTLTPGKVGVITAWPIFGGTIPAGTREIVKIRFDVSPTALGGPTPIIFIGHPPVANEVSDGLGIALPTMFTQGFVNITGPTAANVDVAGRITTATGQGISRANVRITNSMGVTRSVLANGFGYFRFTDITAGDTYVIAVSSKGYTFSQSTQIITITDSVTDISFVADN